MAVLAESFFSGSSHFKLTLEYTYTQSIEFNSTTITYTLKFSSLDGYSGSGSTESVKGYINSALVGSTNSIGKNATKTLGTQTIIVAHNNDGTFPNTAYSAGITVGWANIGSASVSGTLSGLPSIPRQAEIQTAPDFTDEDNPTITYQNKAGASVTSLQAAIYSTDGMTAYAAYRDIPKTGTSYTFNLTTAERNALRNAMPTSNYLQVRFYVTTTIGSNIYYSFLPKTVTLINANPTFSDFTYEDTNATTLALTGNSQKIILGYSNVKATISVANKAVANKGASMSKYSFTIGTKSTDIAYSSSSSVNGTINGANDTTIASVYAIDSRNNSTRVEKTFTDFLSYFNIQFDKNSCNIVRNNNGIGTGATLTLKGKIFVANFGNVSNSIKSLTYRMKKTTSDSWTTGTTTITPTINQNNDFSFSGLIAGDENTTWNVEDSYNIQITIADELSSATLDLILNSGIPTMALAKDGVAIKGKYNTSIGGSLQVDGQRWNQRNLSYAYRSSRTDITVSTLWSTLKIPLDKNVTCGNYFHWDNTNKRIVLDKNASVLRFAASYNWFNYQLSGDRSVYIFKNGASIGAISYVNFGTNSYAQTSSELYVSGTFNAGDYFEMYCMYGASGTETIFEMGNSLLIEVIE